MVHKKSTYRLMFKNYAADIRKNVWEENNSLRLRRRIEEMSHHRLEEEDADCDCDESDDEDEHMKTSMKNVSVQSQPEMFLKTEPLQEPEQKKDHPQIPRLHFSPEEDSPRQQKRVIMEDEMRNAAKEASDIRQKSASSTKTKLGRSHKYPFTTQLSRTTRRTFQDRNRKTFMPCASGGLVRSIGDQSSFNIHLNEDRVRPTALKASAQRNKEIENMISQQRKVTLDDWRERTKMDYVNPSSIFVDSKKNIFSRSRPKERLIHDQPRIRVYSNYCKHCGGRK
ncbi:hypothetical protein SK128_006396 [Halocaridina rubra]|uniref:Uncharacterized protein n=1 Tax=Halocaridina rubra TaxID=373956 RepID=A0AAN8WDQ3_HALRR